jgi:hypothetical protein
MAKNPLAIVGTENKSPSDPQECCDWANERLRAAGDFDREWIVTGNKDKPIELFRKVWPKGRANR